MKTAAMIRNTLASAAIAGGALWAGAAQAGDVKTFSAVGVCESSNAQPGWGALHATQHTHIDCTVPRDLPQKTKVRRLAIGLHFDAGVPSAAYHSCSVFSAPTDGFFGTHYLTQSVPTGTTGSYTVEFKNLRVEKHGRLAFSCVVPQWGKVAGFSVDE
ncbi:MAG: hypothetical protein AAF515_20395 [Pseudomonadota bacterium]